jgi:hypothetical protein
MDPNDRHSGTCSQTVRLNVQAGRLIPDLIIDPPMLSRRQQAAEIGGLAALKEIGGLIQMRIKSLFSLT